MLITFNNVTKSYDMGDGKTIIPVNRVNLQIDEGEFITITGRSGSGKTTVLNLAAGLVKPTKGKITVGDVNLGSMSDREISNLRSQTMGFIFQYQSLLPSLNIIENVALPSIFTKNGRYADAYKRAAGLLQTVGLSDRIEAWPRQLSAGEQKRVVIARSLINEPHILLADEPTSELDEQTEGEIMDLLLKIHSMGTTILMVTHSLELTRYASRMLKMEKGVLAEENYNLPLVATEDTRGFFENKKLCPIDQH